MAFLRYEDCALKINNSGIQASSVEFSMSASVQAERVEDGTILQDYNGNDRYGATSPLKGNLSINYLMDENFENFFDVFNISEDQVSARFAGIEISGMYLVGMDFSVEPFQQVPIQLNFDVYGPISAPDSLVESNISVSPSDIKHLNGAVSYIDGPGIDGKIDHVTNFSYGAQLNRTPSFHIGEEVPERVTIDSIEVNASVKGNKFGDELSVNGNRAELNVVLSGIYGSYSKTFGCTGVIHSNNLSNSSDGFAQGSISVKQVYR